MATVVFCARGNVGRHVTAGLLAAGEQVRVTSRNPATAGFPSQLQVAAADLEEPGTLPAALAGAGSVFLYAKPAGIQGFVEAAQAAGVRHVVLGYPALGHLVQDVAALHALRALAPQVAPELSDGGTLKLSVTQWSGTPQQVPTSGWAAAAAATMAAGLADATQVVVVPPTADDPQAPDTGLVAGVEFTRQMLDMLVDQRLEPSPHLTAECSAIEAEVRAAFASLGALGDRDITRAVADGRLLGLSAAARAGRDALGAVRAVAAGAPGWPVWQQPPALPSPARTDRQGAAASPEDSSGSSI